MLGDKWKIVHVLQMNTEPMVKRDEQLLKFFSE